MGSPVEVGSAPHDPWSWLASGLDVKRYHHYNAKRVSTQYCSFQKKQNSPDWMALHREEDHQTIKKLCYATNHFVRDAVNLSQVQDSDWTLTLIYPVLVIQGSIYDVRPLKRSARAVQTQHVQYYCTHEMNGEDTPYQIDVVTEKYFPSYLAMLFREMRLMHKRLVNKHEELTALYRLRRTNFLRYQQTLNVQKAPA